MSDATDTPTTDTPTAADESPAELPGDGLREGIVAALRADLGEHLLDTHLVPQTDLWVRVSPEAWQLSAQALKAQGFEYFCFLSAIDWMPSPYGKGEDDPDADPREPDTEIRQGYAGGDSRFQVFARLTDLKRHVGVTIKADVPDTLTMPTWIGSFAGANWHERETHEMFGIGFDGHPDLRNLYLPGEFEGHPLRKDFPLLARMIKPWPGIVDVEAMPEAAEDLADEPVAPSDDTAAGDAVEAATAPSTDAEAPLEAVDESTSATTETAPRADGEPTVARDGAGDEVEPTADVAEAADAVEAAHATADADDPTDPAGGEAAGSASDTGEPVDEPLDDVEPAPADASETARAETADAARASDADAGLADLGPGTTTESTDADDDAPTPGRATDEHPDGLTGGDDEERES